MHGRSNPFRISLALVFVGLGFSVLAATPLRLDPQNGHYFQFRGKTVVLVGSSEHYAALINSDFNYIRYLDEIRGSGLNLVRVFAGNYRQYPGFVADETPLNVPPGRFIAPWARSSVPGESDGGNKFDLSKWNPAWVHRLRDFVKAAGDRGIVVEVTLFCPHYKSFFPDDRLWNVAPMKASNNINGVGNGGSEECFTVNSSLLPYQKALARKCWDELKDFDNVFFEIMNEPYHGAGPGWEDVIIGELSTAMAESPQPFLIAQNIANYQQTITNPNPAVSIFNFHYSKPAAALDNHHLNKAIGNDETGGLGIADFPYRSEAWEFMLSGGGLENHLDMSFTSASEDGQATPGPIIGGGGPAIRRQLGVLRWFLEELPLVNCVPINGFITSGVPAGGSVRVLGWPGKVYALYLRGGSQANLVANLPPGNYTGRWIDPRSGHMVAAIAPFAHASGTRLLPSPSYAEDVAMVLQSDLIPAQPLVTLTSPACQTIAAGGARLDFAAEASADGAVIDRVEFLGNGTVIGTDDTAPYSFTCEGLPAGTYSFQARVITVDGRIGLSPPVKGRLMGEFHSGVNLNGESVASHGLRWRSENEARAEGMMLANTVGIAAQPTQALYPVPTPGTRSLITNRVLQASTTQMMEISYPIENGAYDVFFCLAEGSTGFSRNARITMEGIEMARRTGEIAANEWVNYGPYRTTVSDGILNMTLAGDTKGAVILANFTVFHPDPAGKLDQSGVGLRMKPGLALLSWPMELPWASVETCVNPSDPLNWRPVDHPVCDFGNCWELAYPVSAPARFFRLRVLTGGP